MLALSLQKFQGVESHVVLTRQDSLTTWPDSHRLHPSLCSPGVPAHPHQQAPKSLSRHLFHPRPHKPKGGWGQFVPCLHYPTHCPCACSFSVTSLGYFMSEAGPSQSHFMGRSKKGGKAVGSASFMRQLPNPARPCIYAQFPLMLGPLGLGGYGSP